GSAGIPQIKEGAVSKAHGGVLFIDEIGELHPSQMNRLLKVLEDRRVFFESAYYNENDENIPPYIHEVFKNGIPADFRLIGATTRSPGDLPPALRSRCTEIYFDPLTPQTLKSIALRTALSCKLNISESNTEHIVEYARNGRDCVRILETCASLARLNGHNDITKTDIKQVVESGRYVKRCDFEPNRRLRAGVINAMAVAGGSGGIMLRIEASAKRAAGQKGEILCTGVIENEKMEGRGREYTRTSSAKASVFAAVTAVSNVTLIDVSKYDIHVHFPGGVPVDGPSAGAAVFCAVCSAIKNIPIDPFCAVTGEISIKGDILPVGGVGAKIEAARKKGMERIFIPSANMREEYDGKDVLGIPDAAALLRRVMTVKADIKAADA
ncbi:MAG: AAA family ATPase, partial [Oscillospiraceae bacterium]|nr:AAA family ATPase [Oscillospiraceae bacterium]